MPSFEDLNPKKFPVGSIVYCVQRHLSSDPHDKKLFDIIFGIVSANNMRYISVDKLVLRDRRLVNGIPYKEFDAKSVPPMRWKDYEKYYKEHPGAWKTDALCQITYEPFGDDADIHIEDLESLKRAYNAGLLVLSKDVDHSFLDTKEVGNHGICLIKTLEIATNKVKKVVNTVDVCPKRCLASYAEACECAENLTQQAQGQYADFSERDWAIFEIDHALNRWARNYGKNSTQIAAARNYLLSRKRLEDVVVKIVNGDLLWKYFDGHPYMAVVCA